MHQIRVYVDTSVFGGVHDEEFKEESQRFFKMLDTKKYRVLVSEEKPEKSWMLLTKL
ncbi:MAG: hypothetical protein ACYTFY_20640 [Planctomycetota bacterium]